ncbi:uncharacterized protein LOC134818623 [Bolinopsis microptera]|uniref:uncharacterized protein LOC134818623 n=1 Tax=Bolinopsis microptera TaxID=2820187 RepID=UPI00307A7808
MCDRPEIRVGQTEVKSFQGFGKRQSSYTKISAPPGGHTQLNLFGGPPEPAPVRKETVNQCQYERNKSSITDQYTGQEAPEDDLKSPVIEHPLPPPKKPATKIMQPPGGRTSLSLFG